MVVGIKEARFSGVGNYAVELLLPLGPTMKGHIFAFVYNNISSEALLNFPIFAWNLTLKYNSWYNWQSLRKTMS